MPGAGFVVIEAEPVFGGFKTVLNGSAMAFDRYLSFPVVGATYEKARVVKDGNWITGGGVTAGIDFGLSVIAEIAGETTAKKSNSP
jgi:hypothetical protein